jgi:hypothetical protein
LRAQGSARTKSEDVQARPFDSLELAEVLDGDNLVATHGDAGVCEAEQRAHGCWAGEAADARP